MWLYLPTGAGLTWWQTVRNITGSRHVDKQPVENAFVMYLPYRSPNSGTNNLTERFNLAEGDNSA